MGNGQFLSVEDWKDFSEAERRVLNLMRDHLPHGQDEINEAAGGSGRPHSEGKRRLRALRPKLHRSGWCIDCDREAGRSFVYQLQVRFRCGHCKRSDEIDDSTTLVDPDLISADEVSSLLKLPMELVDSLSAINVSTQKDGETFYVRRMLFEELGRICKPYLKRLASYAKSGE